MTYAVISMAGYNVNNITTTEQGFGKCNQPISLVGWAIDKHEGLDSILRSDSVLKIFIPSYSLDLWLVDGN